MLLKGIDYIELYVGNGRQAAHFYHSAFGLKPTFYAGLETGRTDCHSIVVGQAGAQFVLTSPLGPDGAVVDHVRMHGDGVRDIAFAVDDAAAAFEFTVERGARPVMEPTVLEDEKGRVIKSTIKAMGDTVHSFIERNGYDGF